MKTTKSNTFTILPNTKIFIQQGDPVFLGSPYAKIKAFLEEQYSYKLLLNIQKKSQVIDEDREENAIYFILSDKVCSGEGYQLCITPKTIKIIASTHVGQYYGVATLIDLIMNQGLRLNEKVLDDEPYFKHRGVMLDITRGRIPKLSYLKEVIDVLSHYKVNQLQMYMEHTFQFSFMSEASMGKDGLSSMEFMELDAYCYERHIELIPCIATFGHLYELLKSHSFKHLCEYENFNDEHFSWMNRQMRHTIDCMNPESLELVRQMIKEITPCFRSKYLNICGDETYDMGKGRNKERFTEIGGARLYVDFLNQILDTVIEHDKIPMYWGDVILQYPEYINEIRTDAIPLHWWYEATVKEADFAVFERTHRPYYSCPATAGWNHFMNDYKRAYSNIDKMIEYGVKYNAAGILVTDWGDFGQINHLSTSLPLLKYGAKKAWNPSAKPADRLFDKSYVEMLEDIGNERVVTWEHLMKWFYGRYHNDFMLGDITNEFQGLKESLLLESYDRLEVLEERVSGIAPFYNGSISDDLVEVFCDIQGMKWMIEFVRVIKEERTDAKLATTIENWFMDYEDLWRKRYRESELYRIREVIIKLCSFLRTNI
ncbi:MAG: hypothetical protein CVU84_08940 [Firmicutes bacterium HGW-Firmicutes-1]|jgi:hypothetical protein|nr:MAG: hypothetical protein CVU84_08940 [Firmicutes bacterium HGW-Firmicutes-1]